MHTRTSFAEGDVVTTRAFLTLFREQGDEFEFMVDKGRRADDESEVQAFLTPSDSSHDGQTTITVKAGYDHDGETDPSDSEQWAAFQRLKEHAIDELGLRLLSEERMSDSYDGVGKYTAWVGTFTAPDALTADWNVPHLVVYGSLTPEIEEVVAARLPHAEAANVRNHYLVYGEDVSEDARTELATGIQRSDTFFADEQADYVSDVRTSSYV